MTAGTENMENLHGDLLAAASVRHLLNFVERRWFPSLSRSLFRVSRSHYDRALLPNDKSEISFQNLKCREVVRFRSSNFAGDFLNDFQHLNMLSIRFSVENLSSLIQEADFLERHNVLNPKEGQCCKQTFLLNIQLINKFGLPVSFGIDLAMWTRSAKPC